MGAKLDRVRRFFTGKKIVVTSEGDEIEVKKREAERIERQIEEQIAFEKAHEEATGVRFTPDLRERAIRHRLEKKP